VETRGKGAFDLDGASEPYNCRRKARLSLFAFTIIRQRTTRGLACDNGCHGGHASAPASERARLISCAPACAKHLDKMGGMERVMRVWGRLMAFEVELAAAVNQNVE